MSRKPHILATFERKAPLLDAFIGEVEAWEEVTKAWLYVDTSATSGEYDESTQTTTRRKATATAKWTPTLATVDTACRLQFANRIFEIEQVVNVGELNRTLQFVIVERT